MQHNRSDVQCGVFPSLLCDDRCGRWLLGKTLLHGEPEESRSSQVALKAYSYCSDCSLASFSPYLLLWSI